MNFLCFLPFNPPLSFVDMDLPDGTDKVGIIAIICLFSLPVLIVGLALYFKHRREELWHQTARIALEKGQPIPLPPDADIKSAAPLAKNSADWVNSPRDRRTWKDIRRGLILFAIGAAFFLSRSPRRFFDGGGSFPAYILMGLGIAMLLSGFLALVFSPHRDDSGDQPPRS